VARKTVLVCDSCKRDRRRQGSYASLDLCDARRGAKQADLCEVCAQSLPGHPVAVAVAAQERYRLKQSLIPGVDEGRLAVPHLVWARLGRRDGMKTVAGGRGLR